MTTYEELPAVELTQFSDEIINDNGDEVSMDITATTNNNKKNPRTRAPPRDDGWNWKQIVVILFVEFVVLYFIVEAIVERRLYHQYPLPTSVECSNYPNNRTVTFQEWLQQDLRFSVDLCDPKFLPPRREMDVSKPVKVFILMGQSNMLGMGQAYDIDNEKSLEYVVRKEGRYQHLNKWEGGDALPNSRPDVRYVFVNDDMNVQANEWLQLPPEDPNSFFGIELQFGYIMGELLDEPVLLLKSCIGNRALGWDLLPPGSGRVNDTHGYTYAAYKENPERWPADGPAPEHHDGWYAGLQYDTDVRNAQKILQDIDTYFPGLGGKKQPKYEIAGIVWWQGARDTEMEGHAFHYEDNLVRLIQSLRRDFNAPHAKFLMATIGFGGYKMTEVAEKLAEKDDLSEAPYWEEVWKEQMDVNDYDKYPKYQGNVRAIDIRSSFRVDEKINANIYHYHNNARLYMEVGNSLGLAMANFLLGEKGK